MSLLDGTPGLLDALRGEMTPKFMATRSAGGIPNVVPVISLLPAEDQPDTLFFGNFLLRKSIKNLEADGRVGILVMTPALQGWILSGDFLEFQRTGPYVDRQMSGSLLRYNAYTGIRNAGVIRVSAVRRAFAISKLQVAASYLLARLSTGARDAAQGSIVTPLPVRQEFARMSAVKVLAWIGPDGYPFVEPALSLQPAGDRGLVCRRDARQQPAPAPGATIAANLLTMEAVSYQVKGRWSPRAGIGAIRVEQIYAGGPPLPGGQIA